MFTCLKVATIKCKCFFYRTEHNAKGEPQGTEFWRSWKQKWTLPTDRAQSSNEKDGVICLFIMFTPRFIVIKMSKIRFIFCVFCWCQQKISHRYFHRCLFSSFSKHQRLLDSDIPLARCQPLKIKGF